MIDRYIHHHAKRKIDTRLYRLVAGVPLDEVKALIADGADPTACALDDAGGWYCLIHRAALNPDLEVLKYFVSLGINPCQIERRVCSLMGLS